MWESVMLNISTCSTLSLAIKKGQVLVIEKKGQWLKGPTGYPELYMPCVMLVLCWKSYLSTLLTFTLLPPPVHPVMPHKVLQTGTKRCITGSIGTLHSIHLFFTLHSHTIYVKLVNRPQRKSPFSQQTNSWSKMCSKHFRKPQNPPKL